MSIVLAVLLLQAVANQDAASAGSADFDLRDFTAPPANGRGQGERCDRGDGDEIVVCAQKVDPTRYKLPKLSDQVVEPLLPAAEIGLFGDVKGSVNAQSIGHFNSPSAMVTVKVPF